MCILLVSFTLRKIDLNYDGRMRIHFRAEEGDQRLLLLNTIMNLEGCLTVHLPQEIKCNANLMQLGNFVDVFLARHVSGTYSHHQEH